MSDFGETSSCVRCRTADRRSARWLEHLLESYRCWAEYTTESTAEKTLNPDRRNYRVPGLASGRYVKRRRVVGLSCCLVYLF